jgi:chromosome segregation ATPase
VRDSERDEAAAGAQQMAQEHAAKAAQARRAAPHFELDKHGKRQAAAQAQWDAMPSDLDKLSDEIAELEEEINSSDDDGGQTLRDYEARLKDIEAGKGKVQATDNEVASKQTALDELTAEWKPELERLVRVVNDNFADYFRRFRCSGEVALADGRKLNPQTYSVAPSANHRQ